MKLTSKGVIKNLLKKHKIRPSKRLGQNFLINKKVVKKVTKTAELCSEDIILEIGPGIGALTQELVKNTKKVIAVEKDPKMVEILKEVLNPVRDFGDREKTQKEGISNGVKDCKNVKIIQGDILKITHLLVIHYKIVANLPFYITAPVIRKFLESDNPPQKMVLIIQKEVAQRICAKPPKMNLLAVSVQFYAKPKIISYVSKISFWPSPKVDSAIIQIIPRSPACGSASFREQFFKIVKAGFSQPRKQLANNLTNGLKLNKEQVKDWLLKNNIKPIQRAETLNISDWINLAKASKQLFTTP